MMRGTPEYSSSPLAYHRGDVSLPLERQLSRQLLSPRARADNDGINHDLSEAIQALAVPQLSQGGARRISGAKRHRKVLRDSIKVTTKPVRRLARRGGVKRISGLVYDQEKRIIDIAHEELMREAAVIAVTIAEAAGRYGDGPVTAMDVTYAQIRLGRTLIRGFSDSSNELEPVVNPAMLGAQLAAQPAEFLAATWCPTDEAMVAEVDAMVDAMVANGECLWPDRRGVP